MYVRGKYGVEFTPGDPRPEPSWLSWAVGVAVAVIVLLAAKSLWSRIRSASEGAQVVEIPTQEVDLRPDVQSGAVTTAAPPASAVCAIDYGSRPVRVRNLLLRLAEAEKRRDIEMAVSTIEQLRDSPDAADLDDTLARRLGVLNVKRLFGVRRSQWTHEVSVRRGDSVSRIAFENGSTLASLLRLNPSAGDRLKIGQKLIVMNHPRFSLVIARRTGTADLTLNGKFFKRYYLTGKVTGAPGSYASPERFRTFCSSMGVQLRTADRDELEMLLPKGVPVFIREI